MSTHKIIKELIDENLIGAKNEIHDLLYEKLGNHLNEMYVEIAPTLLGEKKRHKKGKGKPDFLDFDKDGDKEEPMKSALKDDKEAVKEEYDEEEPKGEGGKTPQGADNLRPDGAPKDEPGDLSKKKKEILAAMGKAGGAANSGTDAY